MRATRPSLLLLALAAALPACDSATGPERQFQPAPSIAADGMLPFKVRESAFTPPDAAPVVCQPAAAGVVLPDRLLAAGEASHMGRISSLILGEACAVDLATGTVTMSGTAVHTAASGDQLTATWTGALTAGVLTLHITFDGGTGRFEGVSGWAAGRGTMNAATGMAEWLAVGRISPLGP